jgi:hypothetical protein
MKANPLKTGYEPNGNRTGPEHSLAQPWMYPTVFVNADYEDCHIIKSNRSGGGGQGMTLAKAEQQNLVIVQRDIVCGFERWKLGISLRHSTLQLTINNKTSIKENV